MSFLKFLNKHEYGDELPEFKCTVCKKTVIGRKWETPYGKLPVCDKCNMQGIRKRMLEREEAEWELSH